MRVIIIISVVGEVVWPLTVFKSGWSHRDVGTRLVENWNILHFGCVDGNRRRAVIGVPTPAHQATGWPTTVGYEVLARLTPSWPFSLIIIYKRFRPTKNIW